MTCSHGPNIDLYADEDNIKFGNEVRRCSMVLFAQWAFRCSGVARSWPQCAMDQREHSCTRTVDRNRDGIPTGR